jgi:hypothetical protein
MQTNSCQLWNGFNCDAQKDMGLMLIGDEKSAHLEAVEFHPRLPQKNWYAWFEHFFLRFGAGAHLLEPLTKTRYWNTFCWTVIALGVFGWVILFWFLPPSFD